MLQRDAQVTIYPVNAETEIVIVSWIRWMPYSTGASDRIFNPIFNKRFWHTLAN